MAQSNLERVGRALEILNKGLTPFVEREMLAKYGERWQYEAVKSLREQHLSNDDGDAHLDTQGLLLIMWDQWHLVFTRVLGHAERSLVSELRDTRNRWAHQKAFSTDDVYRALDSIYRLLTSISAEEAAEIERQRQEVLRVRFEEQARRETRKSATMAIEGQPAGGLRPWREIVTPHPDVASGRYQQAEFAADLNMVYQGEGTDEYRVPRDFFQRTFLTDGLKHLLTDALQRLAGSGGAPVIELQTNFGGGKTHSLLALYHLFSGVSPADLVGIEPVLAAVGISQPPATQRAVLVGSALSPGQFHDKHDGTRVHTLWGELAWQLLGKDGYALVAEADLRGVSPGSDVLHQIFVAASPCLILIDELVPYVRQLFSISGIGLPAGSFDANLSFVQALTEAAKSSPRTIVVASLPASEAEAGGEGGREALARLRNIFGRLESPWRPANTEEGFEIVRRRLFQPITEASHFTARDTVAKAFADFYRNQPQEFPPACREADYERRVKAAYPIHPELFDRLYNDWSSIDEFQRTRGVLRLMAAVIHTLWERQDANLLILPATVPMDEPSVQFELTRYLDAPWVPVVEKDVDGPHSLPLRLDREHPNLGRYSACRRVTRTIYLGSAPTYNSPNKGIEDRQIKLGCVQPGESIATFGDALRRLTDQATHLYQNEKRYWYATQPSVTRLAQDRAAQFDEEKVLEEIEKRLRAEQGSQSNQSNRGDFARVHICPSSGADIADDETSVRLVILKPHLTHALRDPHSKAREAASEMMNLRGNTRRGYRNTLVFLAADRNRLEELKQGMRQFLAWDSIHQESETLNLDAFQRGQSRTKRDEANKSVEARIPETYTWLIVPEQSDPRQPDELQEFKMQPQPLNSLAINASRRLKTEDLLITQYAGTLLRRDLDRIPLWRGNHVSIKELADYFSRYVYLPRFKNTGVLLAAIQDGVQSRQWERETFAYADDWDSEHNRYLGLKVGQPIQLTLNSKNLVVKPDAAAAQIAAEATPVTPPTPAQAQPVPSMTYTQSQDQPLVVVERDGSTATGIQQLPNPTAIPLETQATQATQPPGPNYHRFYGSVTIDERRMATAAGSIMEEVVKHLTSLVGVKVKVTLEILAELPNGSPETTVRTVMENCRTIKFESFEFEEQ